MNTSFKQGDKIELTEHYSGYAAGAKATIYHTDDTYDMHDGGQMLYLDMEDGNKVEGMFSKRAKLVETKAHEYKKDDRVQITIPEGNTDAYGGRYFVTGGGTVLEVDVDGGRTLLQVKADTKHPLRKDGQNWWVDTKFVTPLAVELPFEVGSRVRAKDGYYGGDSEGIVTDLVPHIGGDITIAWDKGYALAGVSCGATRSKLTVIASPVVERPKAIPATDTKPQIGDTIVAFWEQGGVETRKKGVIASFDYDGTAVTADGEYITYDPEQEEAAEDSVFIVERAPKPEPVKVNPNQKFIDAPVGSIAREVVHNFVWRKTASNEWSLLCPDGGVVRDRNDKTVNDSGNTVLFTP